MGGSDPENVTKKVLLALLQMKVKLEAKIVVGSANPWQDELQVVADQCVGLELVKNPANMAPLLLWADVAISGAGGTVWELACLGLPAIVIALSQDQREIAQGLAQNDVAISLGWHANLSQERIGDVLSSLIGDRERRVAMGERGRKLVDGRGAERVVVFLQNSL
jgi:spore coat polysaccharide biosynthesis predicted glycosyltransferase SpsG